jgi:putative phage-type endonuclease
MKYIKTLGLTQEEINAIRDNYLGASEVGIALGLNPFRSPHNLWRQKTHQKGYVAFTGNEFTAWGVALEDAIAQKFAVDYSVKIRRDNKVRVHTNGILSCSIDRIAHQKGRIGPGIVEIKNMSQFSYDKHKKKTGTDIPLNYYAQHQQQFGVTGYKWGYFVMLVGGNNLIVNEMIPDWDYIKAQDSDAIGWWVKHVLNNVEPAPESRDIMDPDEIVLQEDRKITDDETVYQANVLYRELGERIKDLTENRDKMKDMMIEAVGASKLLEYKGATLAVFSEYFQFDSKKFKAENPDVYKQYQTMAIRKFNVKEPVFEEDENIHKFNEDKDER